MTPPTREIEVKARVPDVAAARARIEEAGATLVYVGRMEDRRYDTADRALATKDVVLRLRTYRDVNGARANLDWKGATQIVGGFKVREEVTSGIEDPDALASMLLRLGYLVVREIDRDIAQYGLNGTVIRFERFPRMDSLVEVEGDEPAIEAAIAILGLERASFTAQRLPDFVRDFETRTGLRAALSDRELGGEYRYRAEGA